jgi:hypothetical protein
MSSISVKLRHLTSNFSGKIQNSVRVASREITVNCLLNHVRGSLSYAVDYSEIFNNYDNLNENKRSKSDHGVHSLGVIRV